MSTHDSNIYKSAFFIVPSHILDIPNITLSYLKVYETIFQFWNHNKPCYLSLAMISERTGVCHSQVCEALKFFEDRGELIRRKKGLIRYFIQPERGVPIDCTENTQESARADRVVRQSGLEESAGADTNIKKLNKENNKILKPFVDFGKKPQNTTEEENEKLFNLWYSIYPNKQKPLVAKKYFYKLKPTPEFVDMLITDVKTRINNNWKGRDKSKIPHPSTYLNQREWEGEIYAHKPPELPRYNRSLSLDEVMVA